MLILGLAKTELCSICVSETTYYFKHTQPMQNFPTDTVRREKTLYGQFLLLFLNHFWLIKLAN
jgi:hypothetical protein